MTTITILFIIHSMYETRIPFILLSYPLGKKKLYPNIPLLLPNVYYSISITINLHTHRSRCSKQIRSLATFSFLAMIFFRASTVIEVSTGTVKLPPVVVDMLSLIIDEAATASRGSDITGVEGDDEDDDPPGMLLAAGVSDALLLPHPKVRSPRLGGSLDEEDLSMALKIQSIHDWDPEVRRRGSDETRGINYLSA